MARGFHAYTTGELVETADINDKFVNQGVMYFADATARDAAITSPVEGMHTYLADTNTVTYYDGGSWNISWVKQSLADAKGDLVVASGADLFTRLAVGTDGQALIADSGEASGLKWGSVVTDRAVITGFSSTASSITTNSQLYRIVASSASTRDNATLPIVMDRAGSVVGISVSSSAAWTAGSLAFEVFVNGTGTGLTVTLNGTNTQYYSTAQASGLDTFSAGGRVDVRATNSSWTPATARFEAAVVVQYS